MGDAFGTNAEICFASADAHRLDGFEAGFATHAKVQDVATRFRCGECDAKGRAMSSFCMTLR